MTAIPGSGLADLLRRRVDGTYSVDEWGLDPDLVELTSPLVHLRWRVETDGEANLPLVGPAVVVHNRRFGVSEPFVVTQAVGSAVGRHLRPVGTPDVAPVGTVMRRLGGVLDRPDEVAGLLRTGALVGLPLARTLLPGRRAGEMSPGVLAAAWEIGVPVVPAAVVGHETGRRWRVAFGPAYTPVPEDAHDAGRIAAGVRRQVQRLLDERFPMPWAR